MFQLIKNKIINYKIKKILDKEIIFHLEKPYNNDNLRLVHYIQYTETIKININKLNNYINKNINNNLLEYQIKNYNKYNGKITFILDVKCPHCNKNKKYDI